MSDGHLNDEKIHINNTFTALFHLLKKTNVFTECINSKDVFNQLYSILIQSDHAITGILHGLQALGNCIAKSTLVEKDDILHIGFFLNLISNLIEALHILRADCEFHSTKTKL
ncbi:MAG: hypothetical protein JO149_03180 [Gammaproteobacteria bacterium]|nr:hypothetical protein [Gammaproteobacteria bacterium]